MRRIYTLVATSFLGYAVSPVLAAPALTLPKLPNFLYLRCNSTSWDLESKSRMRPFQDSKIYTSVFEVKEEWMLDSGDDCTLTASPLRDKWGEVQIDFGVATQFLVAGGEAGLVEFDGEHKSTFRVQFPHLGQFRAILDLKNTPTLRFEELK